MSNQMTPREHDDMRDLLLAGTQRIRPGRARRAVISAGLALILVTGIVGAVAATALNSRSPVASAPTGEPTTTAVCTPSATPAATGTGKSRFDATLLPGVALPGKGGHATVVRDPALTWDSLLGGLDWAASHGLDFRTLQGFQHAGMIEPWTAMTSDGCGICLLLGTGGGDPWDQMDCEYGDTPASIERPVSGSAVRFTIDGGVIDVYVK